MKKFLILTLFIAMLLVSGLFSWKWYQKDMAKRSSLIPSINTFELPDGKIDQLYKAEVIASLVGAKVKLTLKAVELPFGLGLKDCKQFYNVKNLSKPNTFVQCTLSGIPDKNGVFDAVFKITALNYDNSSIKTIGIIIN